MDTIGVICGPDDAVFGRAAQRLAARGFEVVFLSPGEPLAPADIEALDALANQVLCHQSLAALRFADRHGVETWNGYLPTTAFSCRLVALHALERVGCAVPDITFSDPDEDDYVPMARYTFERATAIGEDADCYRRQIGDETVRHRYYALDDGIETHLKALQIRSTLTDHEPLIEDAEVSVELATRIRELLDRFSARAISVDFVRDDAGTFYGVDVSPVPDFAGASMDRHLADSLASLTTIGA